MVIVAIDVHYGKTNAVTAAITFESWNDFIPSKSYRKITPINHDYIPGKFYLRELPCIKPILKLIPEQILTVIIDGYVNLGEDKPGLGFYLFEELGSKIPVIGVAKNPFKNANNVIQILRGNSKKPLFVTSAGIPTNEAAKQIKKMQGPFRIPTLLKIVDKLTKDAIVSNDGVK